MKQKEKTVRLKCKCGRNLNAWFVALKPNGFTNERFLWCYAGCGEVSDFSANDYKPKL